MRLPSFLRQPGSTPAKAVVWLEQDVAADLVRASALHRPLETGGILLGHRIDHEIVITAHIPAGPGAERTRTTFQPDGPWQRQQLESVFRSTAGVTTYLGDWHSHPTGSAPPSKQDRKTAARIASDPAAQVAEPVMLIVVLQDASWRTTAHVYSAGCLRVCTITSFSAADAYRQSAEVEPT